MRVNRRQMLLSAGIAVAGGSLRAADPVPRIAFGYSLYGMKTLPTLRALKICADIGYSGVELPLLPDWPCDPVKLVRADRRELKTALEELSLELPALMENLPLLVPEPQRQTHRERLQRAMEMAHDLTIDGPPLIETVLGSRPDEWAKVRQAMVDELGTWAEIAQTQRVVLAVKPHAMNALHTPEDAVWLVQQVGSRWIKLAFDYSHFERQSLPLKDCLETMLSETVFVHIKDNITVEGKTEFALPGDGKTDYVEYLRQLRRLRYDGAVVVEVSAQVSNKPDYNPIIAAERCYQNLHPAFERAGLRART